MTTATMTFKAALSVHARIQAPPTSVMRALRTLNERR
jgi:hypothetical protein